MDPLFEALERATLPASLWLQDHRSPAVEVASQIVTFTGEELAILVAITAVHWCLSPAIGRRMIPVFALSLWSNFFFKDVFHRPRPGLVSEAMRPTSPATPRDYGVPSGHGQNPTVLWGGTLLHHPDRRGWAVALACVYVSLVGLSRLVLGLHFVHDVVIGMLFGVAWLVASAQLTEPITRLLEARTLRERILVVCLVTLVLGVVHPLLFGLEGGASMGMPLGLFFGFGVGALLEREHVRFVEDGAIGLRLTRFVVGFAILAALHYALRAFAAALPVKSVFIVCARYTLVGLWIALGAPALFTRTALAKAE